MSCFLECVLKQHSYVHFFSSVWMANHFGLASTRFSTRAEKPHNWESGTFDVTVLHVKPFQVFFLIWLQSCKKYGIENLSLRLC